jgi:hypothetical protein
VPRTVTPYRRSNPRFMQKDISLSALTLLEKIIVNASP